MKFIENANKINTRMRSPIGPASQPASTECQFKKATNQMISVTNSIACLNFRISKRSCRFNPFADLISSELVNCCRRMQKLESDL